MDYPTVDIDGEEYPVYADVEQADEYLNAALHATDVWPALDDDTKARALVTATRVLDRQRWRGVVYTSSPPQLLAWPRMNTGIVGVIDTVVPDAIGYATIELALALVSGTDAQGEQNTSQKIQSLRAGSVSLTFFRGAEGEPYRFPLIVQELLWDYLLGVGVGIGGTRSTGTDGVSVTHEDFGINGGI